MEIYWSFKQLLDNLIWFYVTLVLLLTCCYSFGCIHIRLQSPEPYVGYRLRVRRAFAPCLLSTEHSWISEKVESRFLFQCPVSFKSVSTGHGVGFLVYFQPLFMPLEAFLRFLSHLFSVLSQKQSCSKWNKVVSYWANLIYVLQKAIM